jgi:hypothetical protein
VWQPHATLYRFGDGRVSQVPGEPSCAYALLFDPGRTDAPGLTVRRRGPRNLENEGSHDVCNFGAPSHGLDTRCLRFARWVAPPGRKTRFPLSARLYGTGLVTRRVRAKGFRDASYMVIPLSQALPGATKMTVTRQPSALGNVGRLGNGTFLPPNREKSSDYACVNVRAFGSMDAEEGFPRLLAATSRTVI